MHYNILFNGCSFTEGTELQGINDDKEYQRTNRFSHLVANHFGMSYDNISLSGSSNDRISKETIEWFESGNTCDIAIIQLTNEDRFMLLKDKIIFDILPGNMKITKFPKNMVGKLRVAYFYYTEIYSNHLGYDNYYKNAYLLKTYFDLHKIKYIFLSLNPPPNYDCGWSKAFKTIEIKNIINKGGLLGTRHINPENFCKDYYSEFKNTKLANNYKYLFGVHPNELGHQKIAEYIIDSIETLQ